MNCTARLNKPLSARMELLRELLWCPVCKGQVDYFPELFSCSACPASYPIVEGVPRFVPESYWRFQETDSSVVERTKNYFGFEWDHFRDWGFIPDEQVSVEDAPRFVGGRVSDRVSAFESKCRLMDRELQEASFILDAGCGNGRYTYETASRTRALVVGLDIGYGSVSSSVRNTRDLENVVIIQGNLLSLPFRDQSFDHAFSNGVLMHTGNAPVAFGEVARTVKEGGTFCANVYNRLNPVFEFNDWAIRAVTTRLSVRSNLALAHGLAQLSFLINKLPYGFRFANLLLRLQPSVKHMFDWYAAPVASHHTHGELSDWFRRAGFAVEDQLPVRGLWRHPWACNLKGKRGLSGSPEGART